MKPIFLLMISVWPFLSMAQIDPRIQTGNNYDYQHQLYDRNNLNLTAFKESFAYSPSIDSAIDKGFLNENLLYFRKQNQGSSLRYISINPVLDFSTGIQNSGTRSVNGLGAGINLFGTWDKKWAIGFTGLNYSSNFMDYQKALVQEKRVIPGMNVSKGVSYAHAQYFSGFLGFTPNEIFHFELGYGRQFIGDGYRSLLLSDDNNASPYLKINTSFWKIKYTNLFSMHENIYGREGKPGLYSKKYTASHFLDWNIKKWITLGLFESVVWQDNEGTYKRGFDPNYLNPVIFYRPVEFSTGSSDNVLVGLNLKITLPKEHIFYFQLLLDEFLLSEIKADFRQWASPDKKIQSGWWANKYGIQLGWTKFELFQVKGLKSRIEYNVVRPFTYAHVSPSQAYSNYNSSLAHPLGSNFQEVLVRTSLNRTNWLFELHLNYSSKGISLPGENLGDNLQASNSTRTKEYENSIGQGQKVTSVLIDASVSYKIQKAWNTNLTLGYIARNAETGNVRNNNQMIYLSLRSQVFNRYFNY